MISVIEPNAGRGSAPIYHLKIVLNLARTNLWLRKLKWPRVTEAQLRKVLMGRDGYCE